MHKTPRRQCLRRKYRKPRGGGRRYLSDTTTVENERKICTCDTRWYVIVSVSATPGVVDKTERVIRREQERLSNLGVLILKLCYPLLVRKLHVLPLVQELLVAPPVHLDLHRELVRDLSSLVHVQLQFINKQTQQLKYKLCYYLNTRSNTGVNSYTRLSGELLIL